MAYARPREAWRGRPFVEANRRLSDRPKEVEADASGQTGDALQEGPIAERFEDGGDRRQRSTVGGEPMKVDHRLRGGKRESPFKNGQIDERSPFERRERDERTRDGVVQGLEARSPRGTTTKRRPGRQNAAIGPKAREEIDGAEEGEPRRQKLKGQRQPVKLAEERNQCRHLVGARQVRRSRTSRRPQKKLGRRPIERLPDRQ